MLAFAKRKIMTAQVVPINGHYGRVAFRWHTFSVRYLDATRAPSLFLPFFLRILILASALLGVSCAPAPQKSAPLPAGNEWHEFQGTWTASGSRYVLPLGDTRRSVISHYSGSLILTGESRPDVGFRAETIFFNDSVTGMVGRAVWTDEHGDQAFSELRGQGTPANNKIVGTFLGGTGRYTGITGSYEFSWRFLLETEDGTVQGQSIGLTGRVRLGQPPTSPVTGGPRS